MTSPPIHTSPRPFARPAAARRARARRPTTVALALATTLFWTGCDDDATESKSSAAPARLSPRARADLSSINGALPAALRGAVKFETSTVEEGRLEAVVRSDWVESKNIPGKFTPPEGSKLGFMTRFDVGSNCDGLCAAKDWPATVEKAEFGQFAAADRFTIDKDEKLPGGRLLVARSDKSTHIVAAWWKAGASQYYACRATLDDGAVEAADAFERACRATRVVTW